MGYVRNPMAATRILTDECIAGIVREVGLDAMMDELIERLGDSFAEHEPDVVQTIARSGFRYVKPDLGLIEWMPAMVAGSKVAIKTVGYHPTNPVERNAPSVLAATALYDTADGRLLALCDASLLTAMRTGAASAVVTDVLAGDGPVTLGLVGCGAQAVTQIHAVSRVRPIERVLAYDADELVAATLGDRLAGAGLSVVLEIVDRAERAVVDADVLCTATSVDPGAGPVFRDGPHQPGIHVNAVGADLPGKFELPLELLDRSVIVPDHREQCIAEGESQRVDSAAIGPDMCEVVRHRDRYVELRDRPTVFDSTGWALEDLVAADAVLAHAERLGLGQSIDLQPHPRDPYDPYETLRS